MKFLDFHFCFEKEFDFSDRIYQNMTPQYKTPWGLNIRPTISPGGFPIWGGLLKVHLSFASQGCGDKHYCWRHGWRIHTWPAGLVGRGVSTRGARSKKTALTTKENFDMKGWHPQKPGRSVGGSDLPVPPGWGWGVMWLLGFIQPGSCGSKMLTT